MLHPQFQQPHSTQQTIPDTARERYRLSARHNHSLRRIGKKQEQHRSHLLKTQIQERADIKLELELEHSKTASNEQAV